MGESVEKFCADLQILAKTCNFGDLKDSLIRDQIVYGLLNRKLSERLLTVKNLTLKDTMRLVQASEVTSSQMAVMENGASAENNAHVTMAVDQVSKFKAKRKEPVKRKSDWKSHDKTQITKRKNCRKCGTSHPYGKCPAFGRKCFNCGLLNHYSGSCASKKIDEIEVFNDDYDELNATMMDFKLDVIVNDTQKNNEWQLPVFVDNNLITFKLDTGAQSDVISYNQYIQMNPRPILKKSKIILTGYDGSVIKTCGYISAIVAYKGKSNLTKIVAEGDRSPVLGLESCDSLGLIKRVYKLNTVSTSMLSKETVFKNYSSLFKGTGCLKQTHSIKIKPDSVPVIQAPRRVAFSVRKKLKATLDKMITEGIIKKIETPTNWVSSLVIVEKKDGSLRVCLDPMNLNKAIRREHFQIPTRDEIESELAGAQYFTKLDITNGFYQIPLDEESSMLCTFNTPFGRHCFLRMPFGLTSAPEVFQRTMNRVYEGMEGVRVYIDDILVWGRSREEHDKRVQQVLQRTVKAGLTLNRDKCQFAMTEVTFLGDRISKEGITPDKLQIKAILDIPRPQDRAEVRRMLGMITYLGKYIPHLSQKTAALRSLIREDAAWAWGPEHDREMDNIKIMLSNKPVLEFYDPRCPIKISTDASSYGLGAVLLQQHDNMWKPITYASRSLTEVEMRYSQIEKEALGLVFGCERFHDYIYGRDIILETDHKPLLAMARRNIAQIPPRIQQLFVRLLTYQFMLVHVPGKQLIIADALSRMVSRSPGKHNIKDEVQIHIDMVVKSLPVSDQLLERIKTKTLQDEEMQQVILQLKQGEMFTGIAAPYRNQQHDLTIYNGLLLKGSRVVIPKEMRKDILAKLHQGHLGIEKNKRRARESVYWPGINDDITSMIAKCEPCQRNAYKKQKEKLLQYEVIQRPWHQVGTDLFHWRGGNHLVVMDYYSNFPVVVKLKSTTAEIVINCMKNIFSMFGIPSRVVSDNGPPFSSVEFSKFSNDYNFRHITSSPGYPQSNGLAEKAVQIAKRIMEKCQGPEDDMHLGFLAYRSTPLENRPSPGELLMNRRLRSTMPEIIRTTPGISCHKGNQKAYFDKQARLGSKFSEGDIVRMRDDRTGNWPLKAKVKEEVAPRSYKIETEGGTVLRRNSRHLRKTAETFNDPAGSVDTLTPRMTELRRSSRVRRPPQRLDL